ncbi:hypothetical protein GFM29_27820 [Rhizobium leguminosarum bv. viciae]|nr:hypothetical protein [Rhizobium leguminosarum bv. viciae]
MPITKAGDGNVSGFFVPRILKRDAIFQIRSLRFKSLFLRMSLSQERFTVLRDMPQFATFAVHADEFVPDRYGGGRDDDLR